MNHDENGNPSEASLMAADKEAKEAKEDAEKEGPSEQEEELSDKTIQNKEYAGEVSEN